MSVSRPLPMCFMGTETLQSGWWNPGAHRDFDWKLVDNCDAQTKAMMAMVCLNIIRNVLLNILQKKCCPPHALIYSFLIYS